MTEQGNIKSGGSFCSSESQCNAPVESSSTQTPPTQESASETPTEAQTAPEVATVDSTPEVGEAVSDAAAESCAENADNCSKPAEDCCQKDQLS